MSFIILQLDLQLQVILNGYDDQNFEQNLLIITCCYESNCKIKK